MLTLDFDEDDLPQESDKEVNLESEKTIVERIKLFPRKRKTTGIGLKILTPNKLLTRLSILLAEKKLEAIHRN